tara:strand:- start:984 stop:1394 length:411 start_codon:yes stop_codon:yes gene_type:complete
MNIFKNKLIKLVIFTIIYVSLLIFISPIIDHFFTTLDEDIKNKENNFQILFEVIIHIIVLTIVIFIVRKYITKYLENILNVEVKEFTKSGIDLISALTLIGLQKNLIDKLEYITIKHPFRFSDIHIDWLDNYLSSL